PAAAGHYPRPPVQGPHATSASPHRRLRLRGQRLSLAQCCGQSCHRFPLQRLFVLPRRPEQPGANSMNKNTNKPAATLPLVRCAIYTRKSTEEGLEQEFNSLDAQRESAQAFIASQQHEGWTCLADRYDDGGFTGGNMERPALRRLLADITEGKIDC